MSGIPVRLLSVGPRKAQLTMQEGSQSEEQLSRALEAIRRSCPKKGLSSKKGKGFKPDAVMRQVIALASRPSVQPAQSNLDRYESDARVFLVTQALTRRISLSFTDTHATVADRECLGHPFCAVDKPTLANCRDQVVKVEALAEMRNERRDQILTQRDDPSPFFRAQMGIGEAQHASTLEVMEVVSAMVNVVVHPIKDQLAVPRASEISSVRPMLRVPSHFSFPSGHSTYAHAQAIVLIILAADILKFDFSPIKLANLIAENRVVAGLHYPSDSEAGVALGVSLALWLATVSDKGADTFLSATYKYPDTTYADVQAKLPVCAEWQELFARARAEWPLAT